MDLSIWISTLSTVIFVLVADVAGDEFCYNYNDREWHSCAAGCCGSGADVQCCLANFIVGLIIIGVLLSVIIAVIAGVWIYKKKTMSRRVIDPSCPSDNRSHCNVSVVQNSNLQWPYISQPLQPPPYTATAPSYAYSMGENLGHSLQSNQQQTQSNNSENSSSSPQMQTNSREIQAYHQHGHAMSVQDRTGHSNVLLPQAPPPYTLRDISRTNIRSINSEAPPQYGVYADLARSPSAPPF